MGKLIVIEGLDGSGKSTQIEKLREYFDEQHIGYKQIKLPDYDDDSSMLVRMYLNGVFGSKPDDVNAFAASSFYAVDRFASFKQHWQADYDGGKIILADRYTTSNAIHQISKLTQEQWDSYLEWLYDFEFEKLGIPRPDLVLYLDMNIEVSQKLMNMRYDSNGGKKDIHERNLDYLYRCRTAAQYSAEKLGWRHICCDDGENPYPIEQIFTQIKSHLTSII